ncbi:MAG: PD-(D/E)XK nuclease family protein [Gammaproteobacteria bacterium]
MLAASPGLARHLCWRYNRNRHRRGDLSWPTPNIIDLNAWLESCWEHSLIGGGAIGQHYLLNRAQFMRAVERVTDGFDTPEIQNPAQGARRLLARSWNLMRDWGIGIHDLEAATGNPDTGYFAGWAKLFEETCRDRGWVDVATLPGRLLAELSSESIPLANHYVLAGFERMTWSQRRLFLALNDLGRLAGKVSSVGGARTEAARQYAATDPQQERRRAAQWARAQLEAQSDAAVAVVVPDLHRHAADFRRSFLDAFDPLWRERDGTEFPVSVDDGARLADTGFVQTALLMLRITEGQLDYREIGQLLRSPYLRGGVSEAPARARCDLVVRDDRMQRVDLRGLCHRQLADRPDEFLGALERMLPLGEQTRGRREPPGWIPVVETLAKEIGLGKGRELSTDEARAQDGWTACLEQFATLAEVTGPVTFREARSLLAELAAQRHYRSGARADGVQIMTPWDVDGHAFDAIWICGMSSAVWPPLGRPTPLIAMNLQRDRGVPEALPDVYRRQALATTERLLAGAPEVVASWAARAGEEPHVATPRIAALPTLDASPLDESNAADYRQSMLLGPRPTVSPDPAPPLAENERGRGGTRLANTQSACPARAFFELRLGARELRSPPFAPDALARGNLLHDAAEYLYRELRGRGGPYGVDDRDLQAFVESSIDKSLDRNVPRGHPLRDSLSANERGRLSRILHDLVAKDRERGQFAVVELEDRHTFDIGGLTLNVRFDRVDATSDGARLVIDYKTGAHFSIRKCEGDRPLEMQLPMYAAYGNADGIALYWLLSERVRLDVIGTESFHELISSRERAHQHDRKSWSALQAHWRTVLEVLVAEYSAGDCRIDLEQDGMAGGQFAMLTRRWQMASLAADDAEE